MKSLLLAPGPVPLHPEVQKILSLPIIHHRTPEFDAILKRVLTGLKFLFQTDQPVCMHTSTGSGGMESLLINVLNPNDHVLALVSGKFGERWAEIAETYGAQVHRLNIPWGKKLDPEIVQNYLSKNPDIKIVLTQACETSTATAHPVQALAQITSKTEALLLVDGITALGAYPLPMQRWGIDGLVAGSQKALMLPPGLSFLAYSERAWKKVLSARTPRYYFDIRKELKANEKDETFFSSNVPLIRALDFVLDLLQKRGLENHFTEIHSRAEYTRLMAAALKLTLYSESPSDSVTAYDLPENIHGAKLRDDLEKKYALTVMGGQDQLKGKILRLGHMGYINAEDLHETTIRLAQGLSDHQHILNLTEIDQISRKALLQCRL